MKTTLLFLLCILSFTALKAQNAALTGTWKFEEGKLMLKLKMGEQLVDVVWDAEIKDNILNLSRSNPDGSVKVVNSFRKK